MTDWQAKMALNLEATMEPMRGLFFALSTDKDKPGDFVLQEVTQLKQGLLELRQRTSGIFDLGSGALDKMDLGEKDTARGHVDLGTLLPVVGTSRGEGWTQSVEACVPLH